ncbi:MAG: sensor histidine kinase KdpD [Candidatus Sericytochromatia bacterium]|nr:sensor histidine kinase KdpD [Candidatus Sericytochromatia bacterium]
MKNQNRPNPDALLAEIKKAQEIKGHLKIFLGYAPGVGKTYSMLEEGNKLKQKGKNVVIGIVETHKRQETEAMILNLDIIPRKEIEYKNIFLSEMDVEKIISLKPDLVLVDELAHSNPPMSKHPKRYQDIEEILENNIDVYTTVNIQHFESVNDVISQISDIRVSETLPDLFLDRADEIEIIDVPIEELHDRLKEGKVYIPEQAERAIENFFSRHNLTALRELALRRVANKLDDEIVNHMKARSINKMWATSERLLVSVAPSPYAESLIRRTYQMANDLNAEWFALYVEVVPRKNLTHTDRAYLTDALTLAESLGAKIEMTTGIDTANELVNFANQEKITKVVMGKPRGNILTWVLRRSPAYKILDESNNFDIYFVSPIETKNIQNINFSDRKRNVGFKFNIKDYLFSLLTLIPVTSVGMFLYHGLNIRSFETFFILSPITTAMLFGTGASLFISIINILIYDFLFVDPLYTLAISRVEYVFDLIIFFVTSIIISQLTKLINNQKEALKIRLDQVKILEEMTKELLKVKIIERKNKIDQNRVTQILKYNADKNNFLEQISNIAIKYLKKVIDLEIIIMFNDDDELKTYAKSKDDISLNINENAVSNWVLNNNEKAGKGTKTLNSSNYFFLPLESNNKSTGVIAFLYDFSSLLPNEKYLILSIVRTLSDCL